MREAAMEAASEAAIAEAAVTESAAEADAAAEAWVAPVAAHEGPVAAVPAPVGTEPSGAGVGRVAPVTRHPCVAAIVARHPDVSRSRRCYADADAHGHTGIAGERGGYHERQRKDHGDLEELAFASDHDCLPPVSSSARPGHRFR